MAQGSTDEEWTEWARKLGEIDDPGWLPPEVDLTRPSVSRVYDCALGGKNNFEVDREVFERISARYPRAAEAAQANRSFMQRAVRFMAAEGITQFVDFGAGIPYHPNVHDIAREIVPDARVVYLEKDPMAVAHGRALLATDAGLAATRVDATRPDEVYRDRYVKDLVDFSRPVGLLFLAVLHFVQHDVSLPLIYNYRTRLAPGSMIAVSTAGIQPGSEHRVDPSRLADMDAMAAELQTRFVLRTPAQVEHLLEDFDLLEPGVVGVQDWPEATGGDFLYAHAAVGRVPGAG